MATETLLYVATPGDTAVNSVTDITIVTTNVTTAVGDQLLVEAHWTTLNNSTATRVHTVTLDFDALGDVEFATGAQAFSATLMHPYYLRGALDIRASNLCYMTMALEGQLAAGIASGTDTTVSASHLRGSGWATSTSDVSGTTTVALLVRSASATATQTLRLHHFTIRKYTP